MRFGAILEDKKCFELLFVLNVSILRSDDDCFRVTLAPKHWHWHHTIMTSTTKTTFLTPASTPIRKNEQKICSLKQTIP